MSPNPGFKPQALQLQAGELRLHLRPDLGGAIAGLWLGELPVLRECGPAGPASARACASFPLVPYSNRIGHRHFDWKKRHHTLAANVDDLPHALHGVAWQRAWSVGAQSADHALLEYTHPSDAHWPFAFHVTQEFRLEPASLQVTLAVTNIDARQGPVGLGWHPYFPKRAGSRIELQVGARWDNDAAGLAHTRVAQAGIAAEVAALGFDNCFDGWQGAATVSDEVLRLRLSSSLERVVVYTPADKPYYCVEPVSHVSNAHQMADPLAQGLVALEPGQTTSAWMRLDIARA
jgi:aldose 1-epimerase